MRFNRQYLADPTLQQLAKMVRTGNWEDRTNSEADKAELQLFRKIKGDLIVNSDKTIVLHRNEIVILTTLPKGAVLSAHEGH